MALIKITDAAGASTYVDDSAVVLKGTATAWVSATIGQSTLTDIASVSVVGDAGLAPVAITLS